MTFRYFLSFYYPKLVGTLGMRLVLMIFMHCAFVELEQAKITLVVVKFLTLISS